MEQLEYEYNLVNAYLKDIEEIENMAPEDKTKLIDLAMQVVKLEDERDDRRDKMKHMTDVQFQKMERIEEDVPGALRKLKEAEDYQGKIRQDLNRLESEKSAYQYRANELETGLANLRGMIVITTVRCIILIRLYLQSMI